jgi:hypothetical protein
VKTIKKKSCKAIGQFLTSGSSELSAAIGRARALNKLSTDVLQHLPSGLAHHCQVANYKENILILHAESASWATQLRFQAPAILKLLQEKQIVKNNCRIEVRVRPKAHQPLVPARYAHMSSTTAEVIDYLAEEVTDSDLRDALHRLANNGKSGSQE